MASLIQLLLRDFDGLCDQTVICVFIVLSSTYLPGFSAIILSAAALGVAYYQDVDLSYIHDHFMQFAVSSMILSSLLSVYLYVRSRWAHEGELAPGGNSGKLLDAG